jgi:hypothetical protein
MSYEKTLLKMPKFKQKRDSKALEAGEATWSQV